MIGIGTWEASINTMFFKGSGQMTISDDNGEYKFDFQIKDFDVPQIYISDLVESGNAISLNAECDMFKGKKIPVTMTFEGDTVTGEVKLPMLGKMKITGNRV